MDHAGFGAVLGKRLRGCRMFGNRARGIAADKLILRLGKRQLA